MPTRGAERVRKAVKCARARADDDLEIDDRPRTSPAETGVWVQAWVFIPDDEIESLKG